MHETTKQLKCYSQMTLLSLDCLALSSFPALLADRAAGFLIISISSCNDSGYPGFVAS